MNGWEERGRKEAMSSAKPSSDAAYEACAPRAASSSSSSSRSLGYHPWTVPIRQREQLTTGMHSALCRPCSSLALVGTHADDARMAPPRAMDDQIPEPILSRSSGGAGQATFHSAGAEKAKKGGGSEVMSRGVSAFPPGSPNPPASWAVSAMEVTAR
ncbi:hypothetical protein VTI28DRAFT_10380 [Corynascus sepedonium]